LADIEAGRTISHEDVTRRLRDKWLVQTLMLATVNRRVAIVLLSNTSGNLANRDPDAIFVALKAFGDSQIR
jgi:hypothetical protein